MKISNNIFELKFMELTRRQNKLFFAFMEEVYKKYSKSYSEFIDSEAEVWQEYPEITFTLKQIQEITGYARKEYALETMEHMLNELLNIKTRQQIGTKVGVFTIFNQYDYDIENPLVTICFNQNIMTYFYDVQKNYTICNPMDIFKLENPYSDKVYFMLKKWDSLGKLKISIDEFKNTLSIGEKYRRMDNLDKRILIPIIQELQQFFPNLRLEKIKENNVKVSHLQFTWDKQQWKNKNNTIEGSEKGSRSGAFKETKPTLQDNIDKKLQRERALADEKAQKKINSTRELIEQQNKVESPIIGETTLKTYEDYLKETDSKDSLDKRKLYQLVQRLAPTKYKSLQ